MTEAGELWACGQGAQGRQGLNDEQGRLEPTLVDPQHFAHAPIPVVAAGNSHSAAVTAGGRAKAETFAARQLQSSSGDMVLGSPD